MERLLSSRHFLFLIFIAFLISDCRKITKKYDDIAGYWVYQEPYVTCLHALKIEKDSKGSIDASGYSGCDWFYKGKVKVSSNHLYVGSKKFTFTIKPTKEVTVDSIFFNGYKYKVLMEMGLSHHELFHGEWSNMYYKIEDY